MLEAWLAPGDSFDPPPELPNLVGSGLIRVTRALLGIGGREGILVVGSDREDFPTEIERFLLQAAANPTTVALHHARLLQLAEHAREEAHRRLAETTTLARLSRELARAVSPDDVARTACRWARALIGADAATFAQRERDAVEYVAEDSSIDR